MFASIKAEYPKNNYPIYISDNLMDNLKAYLKNFNKSSIFIIADNFFNNNSNIDNININDLFNNYDHIFIKGGVESKNIKNVLNIFQKLNEINLHKDGCILSIGGGVIGDLSGLIASIYKRGINLVHVPTTLTSAVDSVVGGKTGINMFNNVNLLGTYYHPICTFIDLRFLKSLSDRDMRSGISESIKKSIMYDKDFFDFLLNNCSKLILKDMSYLYELIKRSIEIKLLLTTNDEKEKSSRLLLNYGHTFGQAIESEYGINENKLKHGEAISLGMICAAKLSNLLFDNNLIIQHKEILQSFNLPTNISECKNLDYPNINNLIKNINNDKKKTSKGSRFITCKKIGYGNIDYVNDEKLIEECFNFVLT